MWLQLGLFVLGIAAAIFLIPREVKRLQARRDRQLAKALLKRWGNDCVAALINLTPDYHGIQIEIYGGPTKSSDDASIPDVIWQAIQEGKRNPDGSAMTIYDVVLKVFFTDEERTSKELPPEKTYPFPRGCPAIAMGRIRRILNPMYAKLEIFDMQLLPIGELEEASTILDTFSELGHITRRGFTSYALHLAQSMEKFGKYFWKLENWSNKAKRG